MARTFTVETVITASDKASAVVRMVGRTVRAEIRDEMGRAGKVAAGLGKGLVSAAKMGAAAFAGLGLSIGGATAAIKSLLTDFVDTGDELATFGAKVGVGVEALQELRYAALQSDVPTGALNSGLEALQKNLGMAAVGGGKLSSYLKKTSPALLRAVKDAGSTEDAFLLLVGAMSKLEKQSDRSALATAAFGGAGKELILFADGGLAGLEALRAEARRYGVMSQDQVNKAGELDNSLNRLKHSYGSLRLEIADALLPVVGPWLDSLTEWIASNRTLLGQRVAETVQRIGGGLKSAVEWLRSLDWQGAADGAAKVWEVLKKIGGAVQKVVDLVGGWGNAFLILAGSKALFTVLSTMREIAGLAKGTQVAVAAAGAAQAAGGAAGAGGAVGGAASGAAGVLGKAGRALGVVGAVGGLGAWVYGMATETQAQNRAQREAELEASRRRGLDARDFGALSGTNAPTLPVPPDTRMVLPPAAPPRPSTMDLVARIAATQAPAGPPMPELIRLQIDGLPAGATATVTGQTPRSVPVKADVGRRGMGGAP